MHTPRELFTVSRVRETTGMSTMTLTLLEKELGELLEVRTTSGGNRLYTNADIEHLQRMKHLLDDEGKSVDEAKAILFPDQFEDPAERTQPIPPSMTGAPGGNAASSEAGADLFHVSADEPRVDEFGDPVVQPAPYAGPERRASPMADGPDPVDDDPGQGTADADRATDSDDEVFVPALPVEPTMDLLLEAAEGLVQENLKLRQAVDMLSDRCMDLEGRLDNMGSRKGFLGLFRR